jgi:aminobenzoyl-glutamate transport protein
MSLLDRIERAGNALPDPTTLFAAGAVLVMLLSQLAVSLDWQVEKTVTRDLRDADGAIVLDARSGLPQRESILETVRPQSLLSSDGLYWALSSLVDNFKNFPPLAIVLVGMLGIGLADRTGFLGAALKALLLAMPSRWLTPTVVFVGVLSSMALDAGYVVLPPVAAALYAAVGRSPLAGIAAVFAGVAAGVSANLLVTSLDAILAGVTEASAHILDAGYAVAATANLYLMIASTFLLTGVGWAVTAFWVEPRLAGKPPEEGGPPAPQTVPGTGLTAEERRGLRSGGLAAALTLGVMLAAIWIPGAPLYGVAPDGRFPRWVASIIPLVFVGFFLPGLAYGVATGRVRSDREAARLLAESMSGMGAYIVMAFFAAQFIEYFRWSGLGEMLAIAGGQGLVAAELPRPLLLLGFITVVAFMNLFIGSMSAKYAFIAPVFVPMFMQVGLSPELTQAGYRVGDSITNIVTPLNPYVVIILVALQRWMPRAGLGTLLALMTPYTLAFALAWTALLLGWLALGAPLGPGGPLDYSPSG